MLLHPQFDPVAFSVGPLAVRWYGLMYLAAFVQFILLGRYRIKSRPGLLTVEQLDDLLFYGMLGVILGGRLGQVLFYEPAYYLDNPLANPGRMEGRHEPSTAASSACWSPWGCWTAQHGKHWLDVMDFVAPLVPLGLAAGRIGNFINGESWGRIADPGLPWAMVFPQSGDMPSRATLRSSITFGLEGLALFAILGGSTAGRCDHGQRYPAVFLIGYGTFRFITEFFREPDHGTFGQSYTISMGQWLSLPMILIGIAMVVLAYRKKPL